MMNRYSGCNFDLRGILAEVLSFQAYSELERDVAQLGSAVGLGPIGRRFKSCRPDHFSKTEK